MILSNKKISHARMIKCRELSNDSYLKGLKRWALIDELSWYGMDVRLHCDIDNESLREIYLIVVDRVCSKYGL